MARPHLVDQMTGSNEPLVVFSAPAGYGKTTLIRQWAAVDDRPFAWVALAAEDNDPDVLAEHMTRALLIAGVLSERRVSRQSRWPNGGVVTLRLSSLMTH